MEEDFETVNADYTKIKQEHEKLLTALKRVMKFNGWTREHGTKLAQCEQDAIVLIDKIEGVT